LAIFWPRAVSGLWLAAAFLAAVNPGAAFGSTVSVDQNNVLVYTATPGEINTVSLIEVRTGPPGPQQDPGDITGYDVFDPGASITPGPGCQLIPNKTTEVTCEVGDIIGGFSFDLGDQSDSLNLSALTAGFPSVVSGGGGDDLFVQSVGNDVFQGGEGARDRVDYSSVATNPLSVSLDGIADDGELPIAGGFGGDNIQVDVEEVIGGPREDVLVGNASANLLDGGAAEDILIGSAGSDMLIGGPRDGGSDSLHGGSGDDYLDAGFGDDLLDGGAGRDSLVGGAGSDDLEGGADDDSMEGGAGIDSLSGGNGDDVLHGGAMLLIGADGGDTVDGNEGNDVVAGGAGDDQLDGGAGADVMTGGSDDDVADYGLRDSPIFVTFDGIANDGEQREEDNVGRDIEEVRGGEDRDDLIGNPAPNRMAGNEGEDYVDGGGGADDKINGGSDRDTLRARDGFADVVSCGTGVDFAIVDPLDTVKDCERVDNGVRNTPVAGDTVVTQPAKGTLALRLRGTRRFVPLKDRVNIPVGSTLDASEGEVTLTAASALTETLDGEPVRLKQRAAFSDGVFSTTQQSGRSPLTKIRLRGGDFGHCREGGTSRRARAAKHRPVRKLWGNGRGKFETRGRHSATTVRGTEWLTEDRCDGTFTRVRKGKAVVFDFGLKRRVVLRAGESYLAKAR
jgi:Ca2+-binding RTX toxin-like protein